MCKVSLEYKAAGASDQQLFYERLLSSQDKKGVAAEIQKLEPGKKPEDIIRDPYVLEFLGLEQNSSFYESELEQSLIDHL